MPTDSMPQDSCAVSTIEGLTFEAVKAETFDSLSFLNLETNREEVLGPGRFTASPFFHSLGLEWAGGS